MSSEAPPARSKRQRAERADAEPAPRAQVPLYAPYRALGYVTNGVPFVLQTRFGGKDATTPDVTLATCLGDTWALWAADRMTLLFVGPVLPHPISAMALSTAPDSLLVAAGASVHRYVRGREVAAYEAEAPLGQLFVFGDHVVALAADGRSAYVWSLASEELMHTLHFPEGFTAACVEHPATYLNKVVIGSAESDLQLWNVRTGALVHRFAAADVRGEPARPGAASAPGVVTLAQSPAVDVLAVAYADGHVALFDTRLGERLFGVRVEGGVGPHSVAFRTDGEAHTLAVATRAGSIVLFDLDAATQASPSGGMPRLLHSVQHAHEGGVGAIAFVPGQPLLISSGPDNAVRQWFFESPTLPPRLLKARAGHYLPPHVIRYYGDDGRALLTASRDRSLRLTSVVRDSRSYELSQGSIESRAKRMALDAASLKLPPVASLSFSTTRSRDWDDVLTTHREDRFARTWSVRDKRMNTTPLGAVRGKRERAVATASCVSACGNFALLGTSHGRVEKFNMQSHIHRRTMRLGDDAAVVDVVSDALNRVCIVGTQAGALCFLDFVSGELLARTELGAGIAALRLQRDANLLAVATDDLELRVVDIETRQTVRRFAAFRGRILDVCFSPDARWLVACSSDGVVRTFDLVTAQLIDAFRPPSIATSVSFSPTGDFLATAHVDSVGVHLWVNRTQFLSLPLRALAAHEERDAALPTVEGIPLAGADAEHDPQVGEPVLQRTYTSPPQLEGHEGPLVTLSTMPRAHWMTLLHLDTIKRRNRPTEPPKKPERAPFFLPQELGIETHFDTGDKGAERAGERRVGPAPLTFDTELVRRLRTAVPAADVAPLFTYLLALSAPQLDTEIRSLETPEGMTLFLQALALRLDAHLDYEAVQAMLAVFLRCHAEALMEHGVHPAAGGDPATEEGVQLALALRTVLAAQRREQARVMDSLDYCLGTLSFLRNLPMAAE